MGLKLITAASGLPVTIDIVKKHLRVVYDDDDDLINLYLRAAVSNVENFTGRALVSQVWDLYLDGFPTQEVQLPKPPLIEVQGVFYLDSSGVEQTLSTSTYAVDLSSDDGSGWVILAESASWPTVPDGANTVRIRFRAGYVNLDSPSEQSVPSDIISAILLITGMMYEHREQVVVGSITSQMPFGVEHLLRFYRVLLGMA